MKGRYELAQVIAITALLNCLCTGASRALKWDVEAPEAMLWVYRRVQSRIVHGTVFSQGLGVNKQSTLAEENQNQPSPSSLCYMDDCTAS